MKLLVVMLLSLVAVGIGAALTFALAADLPEEQSGLVFLLSAATLVLAITPVQAGAIVSEWVADPATPLGRKYLGRLVIAVAVVEAFAATGLVVYVVLTDVAPWIPFTIIVSAAALTALALRLGERARRRQARKAFAPGEWQPFTPGQVAGKYRTVLLTFVVVFVVSAVAFLAIGSIWPEGDLTELVVWTVLEAAGVAAIGASLAALVVAWPLVGRLRGIVGTDLAAQKKIVRAVVRGKGGVMTDGERITAIKYASVFRVWYPFQLLQSSLIFPAVLLFQIAPIVTGEEPGAFRVGVIALLVLLSVATVPIGISSWRNLRRYLAEHPDDLRAAIAADAADAA